MRFNSIEIISYQQFIRVKTSIAWNKSDNFSSFLIKIININPNFKEYLFTIIRNKTSIICLIINGYKKNTD
ncbi:hypothetical protein SAMN02787074_0926 [Chryseobacterium sp. YR221]|nr:hypothetical protein SAMN02787074_0926 [Chryseobacterium sp. YR221]